MSAIGRFTVLRFFRQLKQALGAKEAQPGQKPQQMADVSLDMIATIGFDGVIKTISPACRTILGYEPEDLLGRGYMELVHPDYRDRSAILVNAIADGVDEVRLENQLMRKDGSIARIEWRAAALPEKDAVYCLAREVTNRKGTEEETRQPNEPLGAQLIERIRQLEATISQLQHNEQILSEREEHFRSLVQNTSDIITIIEDDGTVRYESPALERVLGYKPEEQIDTNAFDWVHQDDVERALTVFAEILDAPGIHQPIDFRVPHADGSWRYFEHIVNNMLDDPNVRGIVISSRDVTERKALEEQLRHQAFHDPLTDLPNRALFMDRLEQALVRRSRRKRSVAVLFVDLDNFKLINDSLGHTAGDQLLTMVGERLRECLRPEDTVARLSGDEFTVLLEDMRSQGEATEVAERITQELRRPFLLAGREVFIAPSIGIALGASSEVRSEDLLRAADAAMYQVKRKGRAYGLAADLSMESRALKRLELEGDLRRAIEREEFRVYYQPEVLLSSGRIVGVEALVRWEHPERGILLPYEFITAAEETGLIRPIGQWVLEVACRQARTWQEQSPGDPPLMVFVNLSAKQFQQPHLAGEVVAALQKTGLDPSSLGLEITESDLMDDAQSTIDMLQELKALGVQLAIDDFGTGYSSLAYLKRFPVDFLKIDRSFVEGLRKDPDDTILVSGIITLARALGMRVIAEGVATDEQVTQLRRQDCDLAQGYYFSKPLSNEAVSELLANSRS